MGHHRKPLGTLMMWAALAALPAMPVSSVTAETLVYKAENKWVAPEDNKPLQALMKKAREGQTTFKAKLPKEGRTLAVVRLEIVMGILAREAKGAIVMEEAGVAKAGTLEIN